MLSINEQKQSLDALKDIRQMMEKSSRFISLSGWSGVAAGLCVLVGAWMANGITYHTGGGSTTTISGDTSYYADVALQSKDMVSVIHLLLYD